MGQERSRIEFGPYAADLRSGELWKGTIRVKLQDLPFRVLVALLRHPGELITREELQRELWGDSTFVDFEHGLNAAVNKLRGALLDSAARPRFIETVGRRGYRFIGPLDSSKEEPPSGPIERSIAVLPFTAHTEDSSYQFLGESLADLLSASLAKLQRIRVVARSTARQFSTPQMDLSRVARDLTVDLVVTGWIRQVGAQLVAYVEVVDAPTSTLRWSDRFTCAVSDFLGIEEIIGPQIAKALEASLKAGSTPGTRGFTADVEANHLYLRGRYHFQRRPETGRVQKSIECFELAIQRVPQFALAYAGLADSYATLGSFEAGDAAPLEVWPKAERAARKALELDPKLAAAHTSLGYQKHHFGWDWAGAEAEFGKALALDAHAAATHHWFSHYLASQGRMEESLAASQSALRAEPFDPLLNAHLSWHFYMAQDYGLTVEQAERTLDLDRYSHYGHLYFGAGLEQLGRYEQAVDHFRKATEISGSLSMQTWLIHGYASAGDIAQARAALEKIREQAASRYVSCFELALIYARLGEMDAAFDLLQAAIRERSGWIPYLRTDPRTAVLRADARFGQVLEQVHRAAKPALAS